ncbi:metallophosphoesterase [Candidatus Pacearchaeota archaeon]|nr:metallophosphoesterase [Candidatus Pacearchaeota archaeon]
MKICAIGDPHGEISKIKKIPFKGIDLILVTGDVGKADFARNRFWENKKLRDAGLKEIKYTGKDNKFAIVEIHDSMVNVLKHTCKFAPTYTIMGNTGGSMIYNSSINKEEKRFGLKLPRLRDSLNKIEDFYLVRNAVRNIDGLRIGFLEWFFDSCQNKELGYTDEYMISKAKKETEKTKRILKNFGKLDILVCHQPPFGYLDKVNNTFAPSSRNGKHAGSKVILNYIKKFQPKYVFCGHIHESEGHTKIGKTEVHNLGVAGHKIIEINKF